MAMENRFVKVKGLKPLPSVRHLKVDLNPPAKANFETIIRSAIFNAVKHIKVECTDQATLNSLKEFFMATKPPKQLNYIKLNKGSNLRQFFADLGYSEQYSEYLRQNMGSMADFL